MNPSISWGPMLNAYPDSVGGTLSDIVSFLERPEMKHTFSSFYILPSLFNTDLDRGFSVISVSISSPFSMRRFLDSIHFFSVVAVADEGLTIIVHFSIFSGIG